MDVSVRELKDHLSQYLKAVQAGEVVTITLHAKPIATIQPLPKIDHPGLQKLVDQGLVRLPVRNKGIDFTRPPIKLKRKMRMTLSEIVSRGRG